jgi:hypothetical protein
VSRACQRCGVAREAERFCTGCGLDFWRAAAEEAQPAAATETPPAMVPRQGGGVPIWLVTGGLAVVLAVAAVGVWIISGANLVPEDRRQPVVVPPPEIHPLLTEFYHEVRDPEAAFSVEQTGTLTLSGATEESYDLSVSGRLNADDFIGTLGITGASEAISADVAVVDGHPYVREEGGDWVAGAELRGADQESVNPFKRIQSVAELEYVGPATRDGVDGHVIVTEKWLGTRNTTELLLTVGRFTDREARMEVFVTDDGVPISAEYTFSANASAGDETLAVSGTESFVFSDWDSVEPIEPPIPPS